MPIRRSRHDEQGLPYAAMLPFTIATVGLAVVLGFGRRPAAMSAWFDLIALVVCMSTLTGWMYGTLF